MGADGVVDHRAWDASLAAACEDHGAPAGEPCWHVPRGMCSARVDGAVS